MTAARFSSKISDIYFPPRWPTQTTKKERPFALTCRHCRDRLLRNRPIQVQNRARLCESSCRIASYLCLSGLQQGRRLFQHLSIRIWAPLSFSSHRRPRRQFLLRSRQLFRCRCPHQLPCQSLRRQIRLLRDPKKRQRAFRACRTRPSDRFQRFR